MDEILPSLSISPKKICFIVAKAREFDAKDVVTDPDNGSNPSDDGMISVLEDHRDDPVAQELRGFIGALTEDVPDRPGRADVAWSGRRRHRRLERVARGGDASAQQSNCLLFARNAATVRLSGRCALGVRRFV